MSVQASACLPLSLSPLHRGHCPCSGAHGKSVTAMLPLSSEAPGGPDMLLTASADGTIAGAAIDVFVKEPTIG